MFDPGFLKDLSEETQRDFICPEIRICFDFEKETFSFEDDTRKDSKRQEGGSRGRLEIGKIDRGNFWFDIVGSFHVGHIGILGRYRARVEINQVTHGGDHTETAKVGDRAGPGFAADELVPAIERLVEAYLELRTGKDEEFIETYRRIGLAPFKVALYPEAQADAA